MAIIEVDHVIKEYRLGQLQSLKVLALNQLRRLARNPIEERPPFRALDDVSFSAERGEVVGIIGHNGAGKSTLLKLLANISKPTCGRISVKGKVAPLIEVGAGLVPDLTGRENIFLNGSILGIPKRTISREFDEIVAFSELEEFVDTPIKRYSSGMQVRLAFAIATSIHSDILIVDEVLAVGDLAFQRKCFDRMEGLIKHQGATVLLVSHNIRQVERLCTRVLLLRQGRVQLDADAKTACATFYNASNEKIYQNQQQTTARSTVDKSGELDVGAIDLLAEEDGEPVTEAEMHRPLTIRLHLVSHVELSDLEIILGVHTTDFLYLFSATSAIAIPNLNLGMGKHAIECKFSEMMLTPGVYSLRLAVRTRSGAMIWYGENLLPFKVTPGERSIASIPLLGILDIPSQWKFRHEPPP